MDTNQLIGRLHLELCQSLWESADTFEHERVKESPSTVLRHHGQRSFEQLQRFIEAPHVEEAGPEDEASDGHWPKGQVQSRPPRPRQLDSWR